MRTIEWHPEWSPWEFPEFWVKDCGLEYRFQISLNHDEGEPSHIEMELQKGDEDSFKQYILDLMHAWILETPEMKKAKAAYEAYCFLIECGQDPEDEEVLNFKFLEKRTA